MSHIPGSIAEELRGVLIRLSSYCNSNSHRTDIEDLHRLILCGRAYSDALTSIKENDPEGKIIRDGVKQYILDVNSLIE